MRKLLCLLTLAAAAAVTAAVNTRPAPVDTSEPIRTSREPSRLPATTPQPTCTSARDRIVVTIVRGEAPSAARMPISLVRRDNVNEMSA